MAKREDMGTRIQAVPLVEQLARAVDCVPELQRLFDQQYAVDVTAFIDSLAEHGFDQHVDLAAKICAPLAPSRLAVSEFQIDLNLLLSMESTGGTQASVNLLGIPIHSFLELRFGTSKKNRDRLTLTVERVQPSLTHAGAVLTKEKS
jgi:hypothetical protein